MYPPVYATCAADAAVARLLTGSDGKLRLFPFGQAPQHYAKPYAVWSIIYGAPAHTLSEVPQADHYGVQFDVYAPKADQAHAVAAALRDAVEGTMQAILERYNPESREPLPGGEFTYRYSFDVDWWVYRPTTT